MSGARAARLEQKRKEEQEEYERRIQQKALEAAGSKLEIGGKFRPALAGAGTTEELAFKAKTVGLVTAEQFLALASQVEGHKSDEQLAEEKAAKALADVAAQKEGVKQAKKRKRQRKKQLALLSFQDEEEGGDDDDGDSGDAGNNGEGGAAAAETRATLEGGEGGGTNGPPPLHAKKKLSKKDPTVDTSFLPDRDREGQIQAERVRLEQEWLERQVELQKEKLEITYSYWDGSGHRRACTITKGSSVGDFLEAVRKDLCREFKELGSVASDALVYVKEDLILPHDVTFYDLIVTKARGKSGPLFHFDVHDDVRVGPLDSRIEKDESHPGKVVERRWYEKNKHIFPASRWEVYDPAKTYGSYTIAGGIVTTKKG